MSRFLSSGKHRFEVERRSDEFSIKASVGPPGEQPVLDTKSDFVKSVMGNIKGISVKIRTDDLENPLVVKNIGQAFGEALARLHEFRKAGGTVSYVHTEDGMMGMFALSRKRGEGEADLQIIGETDFDPEYFFAFFDGFAQGFKSDLSALVNFGGKKSGQLEFVSKAFAGAIGRMLHEEFDLDAAIENIDKGL